MPICNQCGAQNDANNETCAYCGTELLTKKEPSKKLPFMQYENHPSETVTKEPIADFIKLSEVNLVNMSGQLRNAPQGFCWTILFFGWFVPLFRKDILTAGAMLILAVILFYLFDESGIILVWGINIFLAFKYNELFTKKLLKDGYRPANKNSEWTLKSSGLLNTEFA